MHVKLGCSHAVCTLELPAGRGPLAQYLLGKAYDSTSSLVLPTLS